MKKYKIFFVFTLLIICFAACKKDKADTMADTVIGNWHMYKQIVNGKEKALVEECGKNLTEFKSDNTFIVYNNYKLNNVCEVSVLKGNWEIFNNKLILSDPNDPNDNEAFSIKELKKSLLILSEVSDGDIDNDGNPDEIVYYFERN
jgi:hypothetical protein